MKKIVFIVLPALVALLLCGAAQAGYLNNSISETYVPVTGTGWNAYMGGFDYAANGNIIAYAGNDVVEVSGSGSVSLYSTSTTLASSFLKRDPVSGKIYFGESSTGTINVMNSDGSDAHLLTALTNNYDMAIDSTGRLLVSAGSLDWSSTNLYSIDPLSGSAYMFGSVSGPAGPLAVGADGALYYGTATSDWSATGTQSILSWSSDLLDQAIGGSASLSASNATVVVSGTDNVGSMTFDAAGNLYYSTSQGFPASIWKVSDGSQSLLTTANASQGYYWLTTLRYNEATGLLGVNVGGVYDTEGNPVGLVATTETPEPSALVALASLAGLVAARRRRRVGL
ncbi:MAG: PEP-CTERM sorting domain-containing protein [Armatimonadota bacterium]|nr:PEP-CTERM sorting domain-containing protein [Armatimonadota bacterium]